MKTLSSPFAARLLMVGLLFGAVFSRMSEAMAQEIRVVKVKGQQAIVDFPKGVKPVVGQTLSVGSGSMGGSSSRDNLVAFQASMSFGEETEEITGSDGATNEVSASLTDIALSGRFGWNKGRYEFGPLVEFGYQQEESLDTITLKLGGFFDFNINPNDGSRAFLFGPTAEAYAGYESRSLSNGASDQTGPLFGAYVGGFIKQFVMSDTVALRGDVGLQYDVADLTDVTSTTLGVLAKGGLAVYF